MRSLVRETQLTPESFVYPLFVCPGEGLRKEVRSMPGVYNLSVDQAVREAEEAHSLGVPALILFGLPETKDEVATGAWEDNGIVQRAARAIVRGRRSAPRRSCAPLKSQHLLSRSRSKRDIGRPCKSPVLPFEQLSEGKRGAVLV